MINSDSTQEFIHNLRGKLGIINNELFMVSEKFSNEYDFSTINNALNDIKTLITEFSKESEKLD